MKRDFLGILAIIVTIYAVILNIFFPVQDSNETKVETSSIFPELRESFKNEILENSSSENAGLGIGYLVGDKDEIPDGVEKKMKLVGLSHIIVVSGTHLSIIILATRKIFGKVSRFSALYFSLALLFIYIGLIGLSPSLFRASVVAVLGLFAWFFGREMKPERTILLTLLICLLINPYLLSSLGFQLSILAYSGIVILYPTIKKYFYGNRKPNFISNTILASISASITCFPLQLYYFGSFNFLSILANLLILPTIPFSMAMSFFTGLFGLINLDFIAKIFGVVSDFILNYHVFIINFLAEHDEFLIEVSKKNLVFLLFYLILVISVFLIYKNQKKKRKLRMEKLLGLKEVNIFE